MVNLAAKMAAGTMFVDKLRRVHYRRRCPDSHYLPPFVWSVLQELPEEILGCVAVDGFDPRGWATSAPR